MQIASELGDDAVILSTRTSLGPEGDSIIEIVAAIDEENDPKPQNVSRRSLKEKLSNFDKISSSSNSGASPITGDTSKPLKAYRELLSSDELVRRVENIENSVSEINKSLKYKYSNTLHPILENLYEGLIDNEFRETDVLEALALVNLNSIDFDPAKAEQIVHTRLIDHIKIGRPLKPSEKKKCIVAAFIGTTGNGKTSSLVKLALICKLVYGSRCLLVSSDKNKVGGADQLRTFASVGDMDFRTAYSNKEIEETLLLKEKYDFIFFDTSGQSQNNNKNLLEISDYMKAISPDRIFLVISMGLSLKAIEEIIEKYQIVSVTDIILTKLDEAGRMGGPITALKSAKLPLTYLSYGQEIPDDIHPVSDIALMRLIERAGTVIRDYDEIFAGDR